MSSALVSEGRRITPGMGTTRTEAAARTERRSKMHPVDDESSACGRRSCACWTLRRKGGWRNAARPRCSTACIGR